MSVCCVLSRSTLTTTTSCLAPPGVWTNADMDPVPPKYQTWTLWTWMAYWATDTINLGTWETASSVIAVGLNWKDAIPVVRFTLRLIIHLSDICTDGRWYILRGCSHGSKRSHRC